MAEFMEQPRRVQRVNRQFNFVAVTFLSEADNSTCIS